MAAVLRAGAGDPTRAAASHETALHLLAPARFARPPRLEVSVAHGHRASAGNAIVHEARDLAADVAAVDNIPCTTGERTTIDRAASLDEHPLTALVDDVVCAGIAARAGLHSRCCRLARGRRGVDVVRDLTEPGGAARFRSILEREGAAALDAAGLPARETNVVLADARGRIREVDVLFRGARLVVEWDGLRFHSSATQRRGDRAGDRRLVIGQFRILRFEWLDVRTRPGHVADEVRAALGG